jgi:hypothetical protein
MSMHVFWSRRKKGQIINITTPRQLSLEWWLNLQKIIYDKDIAGRLPAEIVGSNSTGGMDVYLLRVLCIVSRGLCDELITRPEESYRLCCVVVCDLEISRMRRPWPALGRSPTTKKNNIYIYIYILLLKTHTLGSLPSCSLHIRSSSFAASAQTIITNPLIFLFLSYSFLGHSASRAEFAAHQDSIL